MIQNKQNEIAMKKVLDLFKEKEEKKDRPRISVMTTKQFTPQEREKFNEWCKEYNVSALWEDNRLNLS